MTLGHALDSFGHILATDEARRRQSMGTDGFTATNGKGARQAARTPAQPARRQAARPTRRREARSAVADQRIEALHRQSGVLAHDFNNLLNVILAANEALAARLPEGSDSWELARISQEAAEKGAELLARLVDLSRPDEPAAGSVDAAETAVTTARLAQVSTPSGVTVVAQAMPEPLACRADAGALESALLNLCVNAGHAMPDGGAVQVAAAAASLSGDAAAALGLDEGRYVAFSVTDPGVGMSPEVLARATDPYFTTRAGRGGTGLGLASVRAFAEGAGGALKLASQPGRGTTATVYLPRA
jgi:signal transduction histidine kinase